MPLLPTLADGPGDWTAALLASPSARRALAADGWLTPAPDAPAGLALTVPRDVPALATYAADGEPVPLDALLAKPGVRP